MRSAIIILLRTVCTFYYCSVANDRRTVIRPFNGFSGNTFSNRLACFVSRAKNKLFFFRAINQFLAPMTRCILQWKAHRFITSPCSLSSLIQRYLTSMCLVLPPTLQLLAMSITPLLSISKIIGNSTNKPSDNKIFIA